jgi:hypothetical protein
MSPILRYAAPGILVTVLCLLPFLQKAFTIDDPFFLSEAHQALLTPLTPAATELCWDNVGYPRPLRAIGPTGVIMAYALIPVALLGDKEWVGHLTVLLLFCITIAATVALAFRCGAGNTEAMLAGLFLASFPVVLAMAGTVMPDILAATLGIIGIERILAWKADGKIWQALAAGLALGLAPLARSHTLLLVPVAIVMLVDDRKANFRRWLPILIAVICFGALSMITASDPNVSGAVFPQGPNASQIGSRFVLPNLLEFGLSWLLVTPFAVGWLILDGASSIKLFVAALIAGGLLKVASRNTPAALAVLGMLGLMAIGSALLWAWRTRRVPMIGLAASLLIALPIVIFFHLPAKYLVPCAPFAAILLAIRIKHFKYLSVAIICIGMALGIALLWADATLAGLARQVVAEVLVPQIRPGHHAWYSGQWAQTWYAKQAGASCLTRNPPYPEPGDVVMAGGLDGNVQLATHLPLTLRLLQTIEDTDPGFRTISPASHIGFHSNDIGYWPWGWSDHPLNLYYVWVVE